VQDDAWLLVPLLGLENNDPAFIETLIDQTEATDVFKNDLFQVGQDFWPTDVLDIVQKEASRNDVAALLTDIGLLQVGSVMLCLCETAFSVGVGGGAFVVGSGRVFRAAIQPLIC
jgi:hypothetical protein